MRNNIFIAIIINITITIFEIILGIISGSIALISDALHNFSDIGAIALSWWGEKVSVRPNNKPKTYGYKRAEIIIAFVNSSFLLIVVLFILITSFKRLLYPTEVIGSTMLLVALIALAGNSIATYFLEKDSHKNLNLRSAWLHSMQDALFSLGVVIGALVIHFTGWFIIDPLISIFLSFYILKEVFSIIKKSIDILMESVPSDVNFGEIHKNIKEIKGVNKLSDLHIWQTDSKNKFLSAHVEIADIQNEERNNLLLCIQNILAKKYKIKHTTIQMVSVNKLQKNKLNCEHCN